jgi:hypothetical protein
MHFPGAQHSASTVQASWPPPGSAGGWQQIPAVQAVGYWSLGGQQLATVAQEPCRGEQPAVQVPA